MLQAAHLTQRVTELSTAVSHLAFHVLPVVRVPAAHPQTAAQVIALRDGVLSRSKTPQSTGMTNSNDAYTVTSGDTLSAIAKSYYGDANKWPLISWPQSGSHQTRTDTQATDSSKRASLSGPRSGEPSEMLCARFTLFSAVHITRNCAGVRTLHLQF